MLTDPAHLGTQMSTVYANTPARPSPTMIRLFSGTAGRVTWSKFRSNSPSAPCLIYNTHSTFSCTLRSTFNLPIPATH